MRKLIELVMLWCLFCGVAPGQATNPKNTFWSAVSAAGPSLWLNFNEATSAFVDHVSGSAFRGTTTAHSSATAGTHCSYGAATSSSLSCSLTTTVTDAIVVWIAQPVPESIVSVTDSLGATAVLINSPSAGNYAYYFANVAAGSHTITTTLSAAASNGYPSMAVVDVVNAAASSPVDAYRFNTQTSVTAVTSGPLTTTVDGDLLIANTTQGSAVETWTVGSLNFGLFTNATYTSQVNGTFTAGQGGSYTFNVTASAANNWSTWMVAIKSKSVTYTSGAVIPGQPGFDSNFTPGNYSAAFPYNGFNAAPNEVLADIEWNVPWTMLIQVDKLNWDRQSPLVLASKGDIQSCAGNTSCSSARNWWQLVLMKNISNALESQLCFIRNGYGTSMQPAQNSVCTVSGYDAMPNGFNYDVVIEDAGNGEPGALSMWMNGSQVGGSGYIPGQVISASGANGFGNVVLAVTAGGTGYAATTPFTSAGGGAACVVTGTANATGGVITSLTETASNINAGCVTNPTIVLTAPTGTGATFTATAYPSTMNSASYPVMVPGYIGNGIVYGAGGTDTTQNPVYVDEFAIFPGNLSFAQITNLFYETKFYESAVFPTIPANPPLVIFEGYGCGPDFSGDQSVAMVIGAAKAGLIHLIGIEDDDAQPNGLNSIGWWRQMLDQAGLADVPLTMGSHGMEPNMGGCPAAAITAYNASTPQNTSFYGSAATMYRTLFAKYPTTPIDVMLSQLYTGYADFQASPADGISSLTGLQLQAQNATNGGWVSMYEGNLSLDTTDRNYVWTHNGTTPVYVLGGAGGQGGPGIEVSRTANDPFYMAAKTNANDSVAGYTNQNVAQAISPYFNGGVTVTYSGGTGYANATPFTSTGGGAYCHVEGIMTASGGVPNGIETSWGTSFPSTTTYDGLGYGCTSVPMIVLTSPTGTGVTLTATSTIYPNSYGSGATNTFTVWPSQYDQGAGGNGTAPVLSWFSNALMDAPTVGAVMARP